VATEQSGFKTVDYAIWGALQEKVYCRRKFTSVEQLKLVIIEEWRNIGQRFIDRVATTLTRSRSQARGTH